MNASAPSRVVDFAEASRIIREHAGRIAQTAVLPMQTVPLLGSLGRTLAEPIRADRDQPPFARSTRDGFACRAKDLSAGGWLQVVGQVRAGEVWTRPRNASSEGAELPTIEPGEAVEIMTGAPVPEGADCVVMVEHVEQRSGQVRLVGSRDAASSNIVPIGAEARCGDVMVPAGSQIEPAQIAAAAMCGLSGVSAFRRPRVAILPTGDELVEIGEALRPFQIRNSNSYSLAAQVLALGAEPVRLKVARDLPEETEAGIRAGLEADLLLISGGVSMGKYDLVEEALLRLGAELYFTGVLIQPGKPVVFGSLPAERIPGAAGPKYFFGLPGNPVSTMVTFALFVAPLLGVLSGQPSRAPRFVQAKLGSRCEGRPGITRFLPAVLRDVIEWPGIELMVEAEIEPVVEPVVSQGSGDIAAASRANCFLMVPDGRASLEMGETVTVLQ